MNFSDKIVTRIPLDIIWTPENELKSQRISHLTLANIKDFLKQGQVNFIVADVGQKLRWIQPSRCFNFWKSEVEKHIATT